MALALNPFSAADSAPTNPMFQQSSFSDNDRMFTAVVPNGDISFTIAHFAGSVTEYSNLHNTKGFRIKCYDALTTDGVLFNPGDFDTYDYFVLIYSDDDYKHHFARIKEVISEDTTGDAFEFEPKIGNEIPKDTKFMIFKGPTKATDVIALSAGILQDSTSADLESNLVCARPLFYFYDGLDKEGELNHDTKYYVMQNGGSAASYTLSKDSLSGNKDAHTFITKQDFGQTIVDYSKFSLRVTVTDNLRTLDTTYSPLTTNEGQTVTYQGHNYDSSYPNARRDSDGDITTRSHTGPKRYLHYDHSPLRANFTYGVYSHKTYDSVSGRGGFSETKIVDTARILQKKITEFTEYKVRHIVHRATLDDWFALEATITSDDGSHGFTFNTDFDLDDFINVGDEMKIDGRIYIVQTIGGFSNFSQTITMRNRSRLETEAILSSGYYSPTSGAIAYRRAYNFTDKTLMVDFDIINDRFSKLSVSFISLNMEELFATVTAADATKKMITLAFTGDSYYADPLRYTGGEFLVHVERFNGEIEEVVSKKENGQTIFEVKGRDKFNKLISPIVNLNSLFSEDIVYSSNSPYNKLVPMDGNRFDVALGDTELETDIMAIQFTNLPEVGDHLFTEHGYIGEVTDKETYGVFKIRLIFARGAMSEANNDFIYVSSDKNYIFTKALGSSHLATNSPTSLTGSANKGVFFTGGNQINASTGAETALLAGTSSHTDPRAVGYAINKPSSISEDRSFQAKLHDEFGSSDPATFDTVNTLMDFEVVSISKKDNFSEIELAPYIPVTLGRKVEYHFDTTEYTFTQVATVTTVSTETDDSYFITTSTTAYDLNPGDSLFVGDSKTFVGKVSRIVIGTTSSAVGIYVYLDRTLYNFSVSDIVYSMGKPTHDLVFINGAHLWGGKILTIPHPLLNSYGTSPLNLENINSGSDDYAEKHGQLYYKMNGRTIGNFGLEKGLFRDTAFSSRFILPKFYNNRSLLNHHTEAYQFKPNTSTSNLNLFDKTDSSHRSFQVDFRGQTSSFGSNGANTRIHTDVDENKYRGGNFEQNMAKFVDYDQSALRLFLYITSDLLPYSSLRTDSLMRSDKTLNEYSMFFLEDKNTKDSSVGLGSRLALRDSNFQTSAIQSNQDISTLKRFGLMRLTELCFDFLFNPVNPEKPIPSKIAGNVSYSMSSYVVDPDSYGNMAVTGISGTVITFDSNQTLSAGDKLYDAENGQFIGEIASGSLASYTLSANGRLTQDGSRANNAVVVETTGHFFYGKNQKDSVYKVDLGSMNPLKCVILPDTSTWGQTSGDKYKEDDDGNSVFYGTDAEILLPLFTDVFGSSTPGAGNGGINLQVNSNSAEASDIRTIQNLVNSLQSSTGTHGLSSTIGVVLGTYEVENATKEHSAKVGMTTQVLADSEGILLLNNTTDASLTPVEGYHVALHDDAFQFKSVENLGDTSHDSLSKPYGVAGVNMVFKPRLYTHTLPTVVDVKSSNGVLKKNTISVSSGQNAFLKYIDLTGCYLVPETGRHVTGTSVSTSTTYEFVDATAKAVSEELGISMNNISPLNLVYVVAHEVDDTTSTDHHLITDSELLDNTPYRILQPNETCLYDFFPDKLNIGTLSSEYTKIPGERKVFNTKDNYTVREGNDETPGNFIENEGVLSMFVVVDCDRQNAGPSLVQHTIGNVLAEGEHSLFFSDGENNKKMSVICEENAFIDSITLSEKVNMKGIVSVSETFTVTTFDEMRINPNRVAIGSTATICLEAEDLINELFEQNGIDFTISNNTDYPYYLAPNFKGVDLYAAIRHIMEKKDFVLLEENGTFSVTQQNDSSHYSNVVLNESSKFKIFEFEKATTLFDFYNEVIVYGSVHKAERKDLRSIQKRGRKTLEHHDKTLLTQDEVDKKALELLRLHSTFNQKLIMTVGNEGLSQLRAGDIINVEIKQENIEMGQYMVLQIEHELTGLMRLELGRYSKQLSDLFSELLVTQKQINSNLRNEKFNEKSASYNFLETVNLKELRVLVRKRASSGGFTLGFGETLNTGDNELGFEGGEVVITDLYSEDLA